MIERSNIQAKHRKIVRQVLKIREAQKLARTDLRIVLE